MRILLIPGHGEGDPGACKLGYEEAELTREFAELLKPELSKYATADIADMTKNWYSYHPKVDVAYFRKYDYVLEIHFNSNAKDLKGNRKTTGTEIYVTRTEKYTSVEKNILKGVYSLGFKNRGVKTKNFDLIWYIKKLGISSALLEVCFVDDRDDMDLYFIKKKDVARKVAEGIAEGFKLERRDDLSSCCRELAEKGIIDSPDYWARGEGFSDENVVLLIKKFAAYVREVSE